MAVDEQFRIVTESRSQALGALVNNTAILIGTKLPITKDFRMLKTEVFSTLDGLTAGEGEGLILGLARGDLSTTEIQEAIQTNGPLGPNETEDEEEAKRPVWILGGGDVSPGSETKRMIANEFGGAKMTGKPRWTFQESDSWNWFVYNLGITLTTGANVRIFAKNYGLFLR